MPLRNTAMPSRNTARFLHINELTVGVRETLSRAHRLRLSLYVDMCLSICATSVTNSGTGSCVYAQPYQSAAAGQGRCLLFFQISWNLRRHPCPFSRAREASSCPPNYCVVKFCTGLVTPSLLPVDSIESTV